MANPSPSRNSARCVTCRLRKVLLLRDEYIVPGLISSGQMLRGRCTMPQLPSPATELHLSAPRRWHHAHNGLGHAD